MYNAKQSTIPTKKIRPNYLAPPSFLTPYLTHLTLQLCHMKRVICTLLRNFVLLFFIIFFIFYNRLCFGVLAFPLLQRSQLIFLASSRAITLPKLTERTIQCLSVQVLFGGSEVSYI